MVCMLKRDKRSHLKKIFIVSIVKLDKSKFKIVYYSNNFFDTHALKGYFLESFISTNLWLFEMYCYDLFNKWLNVEVDIYGNILSLYFKRRKIDLQAYTLRQFSPDKQI